MVSHATDGAAELARRAWRTLEPYHAMVYFVPEARNAFKDLGLKGYWMGYFASRAAPLGAAKAAVITALFYNFQARMVKRAIPDAWQYADPARVLETRYSIADSALRRLLGTSITSTEMVEAATLAKQAVEGCSIEGRTLFAAYTDLPWPTEPHLVLWHAATLLREFRGDGHVATLLAHSIDGCEAHILQIAAGNTTRALLQPSRGWSDEEWEAALSRLRTRGLIDQTDQFTEQGILLHQHIEDATDRLAAPPWNHLGQEQVYRLLSLVQPLRDKIVEGGGVPIPNPVGLR
jgi:hypothetical protein